MAQATIWDPKTGKKQVIDVGAKIPAGFSLWTGGTATGAQAQAAIKTPTQQQPAQQPAQQPIKQQITTPIVPIAQAQQTPAGLVPIGGAQYNTRELQQGAFSNIQPIGGTLYGIPRTQVATPEVPTSLKTTDLQGNAQNVLNNLLATNKQTALQTYADTLKQQELSSQKQFEDFRTLYQKQLAPSELTTNLEAQRATKQAELTSNIAEQQKFGLETQKQQVATEYDPDLLTSQVGKSQAQIAKERSFGAQELLLKGANLSQEEANLISRLNMSREDSAAIAKGTLQGFELQQKINDRLSENAQSIYNAAQKLSTEQKTSAMDIINSLAGVNVSDFSETQTAQLSTVLRNAGIPESLGFAMLQQSYDAGQTKQAAPAGTGIVGEYNFYARQEQAAGREPLSFNEYQTMDVNRKMLASAAPKATKAAAALSVGGLPSIGKIGAEALTPLARDIYKNPALLSNLTPTEKGKILKELSSAGLDLANFGAEKLTTATREHIALFDDMFRQSGDILNKLSAGLNVGPIASRIKVEQAKWGGATEFTEYRSIVDNMGSTLVLLRSGAAVTPQEFQRISGFIPGIYDDEKTARTKVANFNKETKAVQDNYIKRMTQTTTEIVNEAKKQPTSADSLIKKYSK